MRAIMVALGLLGTAACVAFTGQGARESTLDSSLPWLIFAGEANGKCCRENLGCTLQQTACFEKNGQQFQCLNYFQATMYSGNRDYCKPLFPGHTCTESQDSHVCADIRHGDWVQQTGTCVVSSTGPTESTSNPNECGDDC